MNNLEIYAQKTVARSVRTLARDGLYAGHHFKLIGKNTARLLVLSLNGLSEQHLDTVLKARRKLGYAAGVSDDQSVRVGWNDRGVFLEIPKPRDFWGEISVDYLARRKLIKRGWVATLGLGLQDNPVRLNFAKPDVAHVLISGQTRSGKTVTQRLLTWMLAHGTDPEEAGIIIIDTAKKGNDPREPWKDFDGVAHLLNPVIVTQEEAEATMRWARGEIERRAETGQKTPRIFIVVDELRDLAQSSQTIVSDMARIAAVGGTFGLHLVLATQYPQINFLGGGPEAAELKRNLTVRLLGRVDSAQSAANALGVPDSGGESLLGYGDFLMRDTDGINRLTVAHLKRQHIDQLPRQPVGKLPLDNVSESRPVVVVPSPADFAPPVDQRRNLDRFTVEQQGVALFQPGRDGGLMAINALKQDLSIGSQKATELHRWAAALRRWACERGYFELPGGCNE